MMKRIRAIFHTLLPAVVLCVCLVACHHIRVADEVLIKASRLTPPEWILTPKAPAGDLLFFVGRGAAENILDEGHGVNSAVNDAISQIVTSAAPTFGRKVVVVDSRTGDPIHGSLRADGTEEDMVTIQTEEVLVAGLMKKEIYWEHWEVRERSGVPYSKYKYFILVSFPSEELDKIRARLKKKTNSN